MTAPSTERFYTRAQSDFIDWCRFHNVRQPASLDIVAQYLDFVLENNGARAVLARVSAIGQFYRSRGRMFDTKHSSIQEVLIRARQRIRETS